ncbi:hypothetical protein Syun_001724 [Stephania yunnanensis]|uniref:Uncharacterized protein n=1 Tax=Stephania yunnanensis TaxID=152371 RepID=A0AAP0Q821_9MAGN
MMIDTGVRATAEARQAHKFRSHHLKKFHGGSTLDGVGWGVVNTDADQAYYFVNGLREAYEKAMASERVGAHAPEYQSHSLQCHIEGEGLEMIKGTRGLDGHGKEINL